MSTLTRIVQRVIGGLVLLTLGMVAGQVMAPSPVLGNPTCSKTSCWNDGSCRATGMDWACDYVPGGCITNECTDPPNPCYPLVCMEGGGQG